MFVLRLKKSSKQAETNIHLPGSRMHDDQSVFVLPPWEHHSADHRGFLVYTKMPGWILKWCGCTKCSLRLPRRQRIDRGSQSLISFRCCFFLLRPHCCWLEVQCSSCAEYPVITFEILSSRRWLLGHKWLCCAKGCSGDKTISSSLLSEDGANCVYEHA